MYKVLISINFIINAVTSCNKQEFYSVWYNHPNCTCCSTKSEAVTVSSETYHTTISKTTPTTHFNDINCTATSKLAITLATLVAILVVLLVLVISGWVWTCWTIKRFRKQIKSSQAHKYDGPLQLYDVHNTHHLFSLIVVLYTYHTCYYRSFFLSIV